MSAVPDPADALLGQFEDASFDPTEPGKAPEPPPRWWGNHLGEFRWQAELLRLLVDPVYRGQGIPHGDGTPVLTIPGFMAGDSSLSVMRGWLDRIGYDARPSGIQVNVDCSDRAVDRLERRVDSILDRTGRDRIALVGHSRGAHFAKALGRRCPDKVAAVVSLGAGLDTPFDISVPTQAAVAAVRSFHAYTGDRIAQRGCFTSQCDCRFTRDYAGDFPAEVPLTSIYSRGDGVVRWRACLVPYANCVEVSGSHVGLAFNRKAYRALAEALSAATAA
ncbi:MAG: triacylglycerol lipase [Thermoleophilaceae bacterium]|jgi:pimeloyl-ACP methyl ester carboxylesterase|nr:triacylglycerol lipase [Thermoleophilaceae bacterium]